MGLLTVEKQMHAVSLINPSGRYLDADVESQLYVSAFQPIHRSLKYKQTDSNSV